MKMEEMEKLKIADIMGYLLRDIDIKDFKKATPKNITDRLKKDCDILQVKMFEALKGDNIGTYNNLQKALVNNINAIKSLKEDYKLIYSEYETTKNPLTGTTNKQVAVWEQNSDGEIRNHKVWDVVDDNKKQDNYHAVWKKNMELLINEDGNEKIIIPTSEAIRGVGKTTFLIEQAIKHDGVYVGASDSRAREAYKTAKTMFGENLRTASPILDYRGCNKLVHDKPLYIDEGVDLDRIDLDKNRYVAFKYMPLIK